MALAMDKPFRFTLGDIFRGGVINPLSVSGRVEAGNIQIGDQVLVMPSEERATIKGIDVGSQSTNWAVGGQIVVLHLSDIDAIHLK